MESLGALPMLLIVAAVLWLVFKLLKWPLKIFWKLLVNMAIGFVILLVINLISGLLGFGIPITWLTSLVTGIFGIPGVIVLAILALLGII